MTYCIGHILYDLKEANAITIFKQTKSEKLKQFQMDLKRNWNCGKGLANIEGM